MLSTLASTSFASFSLLGGKLARTIKKPTHTKPSAKGTLRDGLLFAAMPTIALGSSGAAQPESWRQAWPYVFRPGDKVWAFTFGIVWRRGTVVGAGEMRRAYRDEWEGVSAHVCLPGLGLRFVVVVGVANERCFVRSSSPSREVAGRGAVMSTRRVCVASSRR
jgi:hypothetical protein